MTGPAGNELTCAEVVLVQAVDHGHHPARDHFSRSVRCPIDLVCTGADMTIRTVELQGGRHEAHRLQEIVHRNSPEYLDVLEDLFREKRLFLWRGWGARQRNTNQHENA